MAAIAPGPPGHWLWGNLPAFRRDELGMVLDSARRYGDVIRFRLGPVVVHLLNHPDHVEHVLVRQARNYPRQGRSARFLKEVCGRSMLTTDGSLWREHRRLMQPVFHAQQVAPLAGPMAQATAKLLERWEAAALRCETIDAASEMNRLAFTIAGAALFGEDVSSEAGAVETALTEVMAQTFVRVQSLVSWPRWLPTTRNRRFQTALARIDRVVYRIIQRRRRSGGAQADLLSRLLAAGADNGGFSDEDLRNETVTLLLAGHETTANALAWTFDLLARHPDEQEKVRAEVLRFLGPERNPTAEDQLPFTTAVLQESMRLYPPIWILERQAAAEDTIGGFRIPARSMVVISPWTLHRHPAFWEEPERFRPERFAGGRAFEEHSYIPFGIGPHQCIGRHLALLEARTVLAMAVRRFKWEPIEEVRPKGGITLRQEPGLRIRLAR